MATPRFQGTLDGRWYTPALNRRGKLDVRCASAYTPRSKEGLKQLMLSCYISAAHVNAGKRGGNVHNADICVERTFVPEYTSEEAQARRLEFMATIAATRIGVDFEHRLPVSTRTPK
jgi:hypothetical protein